MQKQKLQQSYALNLSPEQIQFLSLLQIPLSSLNSRIQDELEENPALEEIEDNEEITIEKIEENRLSSYKYRQHKNTDLADPQIAQNEESLQEHLKKQLLLLNLENDQQFLAEYLIDSLDEHGWLSREIFSIADDILVNLNLEFSESEIENSLLILQSLEPIGVGARNLQECLIIQLKSKEQNPIIEMSINILQNQYDKFSKKNFERIIEDLNISEGDLKAVYLTVEKLNPFPASNFIDDYRESYIVPDFLISIQGEENVVSLTKRSGKELRVSSHYQNMILETNNDEAKQFLEQKIKSANWFKNAILQREKTLLQVMNVIVKIQDSYFKSGDEKDLKAMKLMDIAQQVKMDPSTISRVTNSKYAQTFFGTFLLKDLFSEAYRKDNGEIISTKVIKQRLKEIIDMEDKKNPLTDDKLCDLLGQDEYHIARRTVAKYRESLGIETSKYRRTI